MFSQFFKKLSQPSFILIAAALTLVITAPMLGRADSKSSVGGTPGYNLTPIEELGKHIYFDERLSNPPRQSCASCHDPRAGWTFPVSIVNRHPVAARGANPLTVGSLKPPTNGYASLISPLQPCIFGVPGLCGGNFWNGRSIGYGGMPQPHSTAVIGPEIIDYAPLDGATKDEYKGYLGPTADQAINPFLNPVEQNIQPKEVCRRVARSRYAKLFVIAWGEPCGYSDDIYPGTALRVYEVNFRRIGLSLAAWQASAEVNSFTSKRDIALQRELDGIDVDSTPGQFPLVGFTAQENYGHDLFYATFFRPLLVNGVPKFSNCSFCHSDNPFADTGAEPFQQYADDGYHIIGTPHNPEIPGNPPPNVGLAGLTDNPAHVGFHKTPTLRNVDKRPYRHFCKAFAHNGWFKSLESIVHYYNTAFIGGATANSFGITRCPENIKTERDALRCNCWPAPEYEGPAIPVLLGDLGLTLEDEAALVAYMKTLTDMYTPKPPRPYK